MFVYLYICTNVCTHVHMYMYKVYSEILKVSSLAYIKLDHFYPFTPNKSTISASWEEKQADLMIFSYMKSKCFFKKS